MGQNSTTQNSDSVQDKRKIVQNKFINKQQQNIMFMFCEDLFYSQIHSNILQNVFSTEIRNCHNLSEIFQVITH